MPADIRFRCWQITVPILIFGQALGLIAARFTHPSLAAVHWGIGLFELPILLLVALLITAPRNAIRLSPLRSRLIILIGTLLLYALAFIITVHRDTAGQPIVPLILFGSVSIAVTGLQRSGISAWWAVPLAWNPLLLALPLIAAN